MHGVRRLAWCCCKARARCALNWPCASCRCASHMCGCSVFGVSATQWLAPAFLLLSLHSQGCYKGPWVAISGLHGLLLYTSLNLCAWLADFRAHLYASFLACSAGQHLTRSNQLWQVAVLLYMHTQTAWCSASVVVCRTAGAPGMCV